MMVVERGRPGFRGVQVVEVLGSVFGLAEQFSGDSRLWPSGLSDEMREVLWAAQEYGREAGWECFPTLELWFGEGVVVSDEMFSVWLGRLRRGVEEWRLVGL